MTADVCAIKAVHRHLICLTVAVWPRSKQAQNSSFTHIVLLRCADTSLPSLLSPEGGSLVLLLSLPLLLNLRLPVAIDNGNQWHLVVMVSGGCSSGVTRTALSAEQAGLGCCGVGWHPSSNLPFLKVTSPWCMWINRRTQHPQGGFKIS